MGLVYLEKHILFNIYVLKSEAGHAGCYLAKKDDSPAVVQPRRQNGQQIIQ